MIASSSAPSIISTLLQWTKPVTLSGSVLDGKKTTCCAVARPRWAGDWMSEGIIFSKKFN